MENVLKIQPWNPLYASKVNWIIINIIIGLLQLVADLFACSAKCLPWFVILIKQALMKI